MKKRERKRNRKRRDWEESSRQIRKRADRREKENERKRTNQAGRQTMKTRIIGRPSTSRHSVQSLRNDDADERMKETEKERERRKREWRVEGDMRKRGANKRSDCILSESKC